jgi:hypothetical protein
VKETAKPLCYNMPMATPLTDATVDRIHRMFSGPDREIVSTLLTERCGDTLALSTPADPTSLERIRIAALKLSGGSVDLLQRAIDLANIDWRDVLVTAGFASDLAAHTSWWPDKQN